jgi:hypothetical protein
MALKKKIELDSGVILNYHRITSINKITNSSVIVEVSSYTNEAKREEEARYQELQRKEDRTEEEQEELDRGINVYIDTDYIDFPYDEKIEIKELYEQLKTLDKYKGATDC